MSCRGPRCRIKFTPEQGQRVAIVFCCLGYTTKFTVTIRLDNYMTILTPFHLRRIQGNGYIRRRSTVCELPPPCFTLFVQLQTPTIALIPVIKLALC